MDAGQAGDRQGMLAGEEAISIDPGARLHCVRVVFSRLDGWIRRRLDPGEGKRTGAGSGGFPPDRVWLASLGRHPQTAFNPGPPSIPGICNTQGGEGPD
jgi:hypothetical protein